MLRRVLPVVALVLIPGALRAQGIRGQVLERDSVHAASGIVVQLLDSTGTTVARALSSEEGQFALRAPAAGKFRLRALRIGYRPTIAGPVMVSDGEMIDYRLVLSSPPIELQPVIVSDTRVCRVNPDSGSAAAHVWDAARTALTATVLTQAQRRYQLRVGLFDRWLDASGHHVEKEEQWENEGVGITPFKSAPADTLARYSYVRTEPTGVTYYAPDADVLLSEYFARFHCFRLQAGDPGISGGADWIGLGFEPIAHERADVQGVLWLDRRSAELREMSFTFTAVPDAARRARAGGSEQFARLPGGEWIVRRWQIRMPVLEPRRGDASFGLSAMAPFGHGENLTVSQIKVSGGETLEVGKGTAAIWAGRHNAIAGTVTDETGNVPRPSVRVRLDGTARSTITDSAGRFSFAHLLPARYTVTADDSLLETLGLPHGAPVTVGDSGASAVRLPLLSLHAAAATFCKDERLPRSSALLRLRAVDSTTGTPLPRASVTVTWMTASIERGNVSAIRGNRGGTSDEHGLLWACGIPTGVRLTIHVLADDHRIADRELIIPEGSAFFSEIATRRTLRIRQRRAPGLRA